MTPTTNERRTMNTCNHLIRCAVTAHDRHSATLQFRDNPAMLVAMLTGPCTSPTFAAAQREAELELEGE